MDKMQARQVMEPDAEALPNIPLDGRRLLGNPDAQFGAVAGEAGIKRLEGLQQVHNQWRSAGLAGVLSLMVLAAAWVAERYALVQLPALPVRWSSVRLACCAGVCSVPRGAARPC
jgi:hypothetical protein